MTSVHISERLISKLRAHHLLPEKGTPVELRRTFSSKGSRRAGKWVWYAVNPVTREPFNIGSRFTMQALLDADQLVSFETPQGTSIDAAGTAPRYEVRPGQQGANPIHPYDLDGMRLAISEAVFASRDPATPAQEVVSISDGSEKVVRRYENGHPVTEKDPCCDSE